MTSLGRYHTPPDEDVYVFPASFAQQQLWLLDQVTPSSPTYNIPTAVRLRGPLDVAALKQSIDAIVQRHETLRTTFVPVGGQPMQVIAPTLTVPLPVVDLQALPEGEREAEALRLTTAEAQQPFDLAHGPLVRTTLLRLGTQEHVLLLTLHHIISDGRWSTSVFLRELATLYGAVTTDSAAGLPELAIQYADYAHWQREWLQGEALETHLAYWRQQLAGAPSVLELPADRPRLPVQTFRGATQRFELPPAVSQGLRKLSRQEGVTLFMTLLAAFQVLLQRYTGCDDLVVGSPVAGRTRAETEGLIGCFINTLVLRTDLAGNPPFLELLARVREVTLGAYAHQDIPFERLVEELQPERDHSRNPLFQVMFVLQNAPTQTPELPGLAFESQEVDTGTAKFDVTLFMEETAPGLRGWIEYNTDLFAAATISRMAGHFQILLAGIVANPTQRLSELPLLSEAERQQLLVEWNDTRTPYPQAHCIHELFEAQVERTPEAMAVVYAEQQLTYQELNQRANRLAHHLRAWGVGPEVLVGLCLERSLEMVVGLLGILKAGAAYVPLDPAYPAERLAFMLEDARVTVLLTQERLLDRLPRQAARMVCLDTDWDVIRQQCVNDVRTEVTPDNLAYVIYTSGSTGRPKGVLVSHRNLVASSHARVTYYSEPVRNFLLLSSFAFDSSVAGIFWTLCQGGTLWLPTETLQRDASQLAAFMARNRISHTLSVPSLYVHLLAEAEPRQLASLRTVIVAGEPCARDLVVAHHERLPHASLFNEYGPTEATVWSTVYACLAPSVPTLIPIGRPIPNTQAYILDDHLNPVPIGVPGELHVGGAGLARGYLNRPELTAEKFMPHPFSSEPGARLYKTGDLARYRPDGAIEFLGRGDNQVKIRGYRIELGEIEAVLAQHPALQEAVVLARDDVPGDRRLVAYVVPRPDVPLPSADELRQSLQQRLPAYMVPAAFVPLEALPLTPNGKVDRKALPPPDRSRAAQEALVAPRTPAEDLLAAIWADVLQVEQVGIYDNFFELGGHSLLATQVISRVRKALQVEVPVRRIFEAPTLAELAAVVRELQANGARRQVPAIRPVSLETYRVKRPS